MYPRLDLVIEGTIRIVSASLPSGALDELFPPTDGVYEVRVDSQVADCSVNIRSIGST
jgi:hypothetical protein